MARSDSDPILLPDSLPTEFRPLSERDTPTETAAGQARALTELAPGAATEAQDPSEPARVDPAVAAGVVVAERYQRRSTLGRGGMGEVQLCKDTRIGRDVALKLMLPRIANESEGRARFLREARVQGQLEHPTIVPVHDLELLEGGAAYFTMKRVRGLTLAEIIARADGDENSSGNADPRKRYTRRRLLSLFSTVCLGVDFAHSRGVVHRDLKPSNVMIGDFGEVYLLDWGLAKVIGAPDESLSAPEESLEEGEVTTQVGAVMGTPGYMAPEQLDADLGETDARSDVYALGAVLFEMLTGRPVIESKQRSEILRQTLEGVDARATVRAPGSDVAPELEDICLRALARDPSQRFQTARALHDALEQYLEGAQDQERRGRLSEQHAQAAQRALEESLKSESEYEPLRGNAMRELGRALALDPENHAARATMLRLLTEPPRVVPEEVKERVREVDDAGVRMGARLNVPLLFAWLPFLPLAAWSGIRSWSMVALVIVPLFGVTVVSWVVSRQRRPSTGLQVLAIVLTLFAYVATTTMLGWFFFFPALLATYTVILHSHPYRAPRRVVLVLSMLALLTPLVLEALGVLPSSYSFEGGALIVHPQMLELRQGPITLLVLLGTFSIVVLPALYVQRLRMELSAAQLRLQTTAWHLERLVQDDELSSRAAPHTSSQKSASRSSWPS